MNIMPNYQTYFRGEKVTLMGLGLLGRGLGDAIFLAKQGAELIITDLRDEKTLAPSLAKLKRFKNIRYTLGGHKLEDFRNRPKPSGDGRGPDFILKAAGVPLDSPYLAEARKDGIPIEMDASLFAKLMPKGVTLVGVTGTRGKSTTTALIYEILSSSAPFQRGSTESSRGRGSGRRIFKGGNLVPEATLPLLEKVRAGDIVVLELDSWQLQGFHDAKISPQIAVFTTFLDDHLIYYKGDTDCYFEDKVAIFKYQKQGDVLVAGERVAQLIGKSDIPVVGDFVVAKKEDVSSVWKIPLLGEHNLENIACAIKVGEHFQIPAKVIQKVIENFKPIAGRLQLLRMVKGVKIYNDNNATTPDATIAALRALSTKSEIPNRASPTGFSRNPKQIPNSKLLNAKRSLRLFHSTLSAERHIVLIMGGTDKGLDMSKLVEEIPKHCKAVVLLKESGTDKLLSRFPSLKSPSTRGVPGRAGVVFLLTETLKECVEEAMKLAKKGDIILFSPAFASFGRWFENEYDRSTQFLELVKELK